MFSELGDGPCTIHEVFMTTNENESPNRTRHKNFYRNPKKYCHRIRKCFLSTSTITRKRWPRSPTRLGCRTTGLIVSSSVTGPLLPVVRTSRCVGPHPGAFSIPSTRDSTFLRGHLPFTKKKIFVNPIQNWSTTEHTKMSKPYGKESWTEIS